MPVNEFGQPVGESLPEWTPRQRPAAVRLTGRTVRLEPLNTDHGEDLYRALMLDSPGSLWTYLMAGPFSGREPFREYVAGVVGSTAAATFAVVVDGAAAGVASLMRADPAMGTVEVGGIAFGQRLQRTTAATEAIRLLAGHVFDDLGYRRFEWKCDSLNEPSRRAALRFGFGYEGRFRNAVVYKGRSRDTDWFSIVDTDWPALRERYDAWLDPANFDACGHQRSPLNAGTAIPHRGTGGTLS